MLTEAVVGGKANEDHVDINTAGGGFDAVRPGAVCGVVLGWGSSRGRYRVRLQARAQYVSGAVVPCAYI